MSYDGARWERTHLDVATTETALGTVLENSGWCPEAEEFYRRALNMKRRGSAIAIR